MQAVSGMSANRFDAASQSVISYLKAAVPLGFWSVTRYDGAAQVYLTTADDAFGFETGDTVAWSDTLCRHVVSGAGPEIAPDTSAVPLYAANRAVRELPIGAYVGVPIRRGDGELFGTLCGIDPQRQPDGLAEHAATLHVLRDLLTHVLDADLELVRAARAIESAELRADTDAMTGLLNRRGWDRYVQLEDERFRRYGDPCSVLIIDLDGLKGVNDTLGHAAGDDLIRRGADVLARTARASDVIARLGGDEFGVIATQTTPDVASALQERLETAFAEAGIGASVGRAELSVKSGLPAACEHADAAMYRAKVHRRLRLASTAS